ncbi:MAG: hypothetical protein PHH26_00380 [Candidatus Thermoplasmatota archaeon]|nr:hypothetical protein [Candidatus Thermoplasmatota archaeon]
MAMNEDQLKSLSSDPQKWTPEQRKEVNRGESQIYEENQVIEQRTITWRDIAAAYIRRHGASKLWGMIGIAAMEIGLILAAIISQGDPFWFLMLGAANVPYLLVSQFTKKFEAAVMARDARYVLCYSVAGKEIRSYYNDWKFNGAQSFKCHKTELAMFEYSQELETLGYLRIDGPRDSKPYAGMNIMIADYVNQNSMLVILPPYAELSNLSYLLGAVPENDEWIAQIDASDVDLKEKISYLSQRIREIDAMPESSFIGKSKQEVKIELIKQQLSAQRDRLKFKKRIEKITTDYTMYMQSQNARLKFENAQLRIGFATATDVYTAARINEFFGKPQPPRVREETITLEKTFGSDVLIPGLKKYSGETKPA